MTANFAGGVGGKRVGLAGGLEGREGKGEGGAEWRGEREGGEINIPLN